MLCYNIRCISNWEGMRSSDCVLRVNTLCQIHFDEDNGTVNIYHSLVRKGPLRNSATHDRKPLKCEGVEVCLDVGHISWSS